MMKAASILIPILLFQSAPSIANILTTHDFQSIQNQINQADTHTLVIFDVNSVLLQPSDQILKEQNKPYLAAIKKEIETRHPREQAEQLYSIIFLQRESENVDERMPRLVQQLQEKGVKILALTNCFTCFSGTLEQIQALEDWRIHELYRFGYHFEKSWPNLDEYIFKLPGLTDPKRFPTFQRGVAFTHANSKGVVLKAFLEYAQYKPKKILFIDDKRKNLESVAEIAQALNIQFDGIEYTRIRESHVENLDQKRVKLQFEVLENEHRWLSDQEAAKQMDKKRGL